MSTKPISLLAAHIADEIKLKQVKALLNPSVISESSADLYFSLNETDSILILHYGVIVFANMNDAQINDVIAKISPAFVRPFSMIFKEQYTISKSSHLKCHFDNITVPQLSKSVIKTVMLNLAQSVALDYYLNTTETLLDQVTLFTDELEARGKIKTSQSNMMKFLGRVLNVKNKIMANLYIFDVPDSVWDDEHSDAVNTAMVLFFDLRLRFKEVTQTLHVIEDNLNALLALSQHKENRRLEWIIIILIAIEIVFYFID